MHLSSFSRSMDNFSTKFFPRTEYTVCVISRDRHNSAVTLKIVWENLENRIKICKFNWRLITVLIFFLFRLIKMKKTEYLFFRDLHGYREKNSFQISVCVDLFTVFETSVLRNNEILWLTDVLLHRDDAIYQKYRYRALDTYIEEEDGNY